MTEGLRTSSSFGLMFNPLRKNGALSYVKEFSVKPLMLKNMFLRKTQEHHNMEGRDLVREGTVVALRGRSEICTDMGWMVTFLRTSGFTHVLLLPLQSNGNVGGP